MTGLAEHFRQARSKEDFADRYLGYMGDLLARVDREAVARILEAFLAAHENGRMADVSLHTPTPRGEYGPVEDVFSALDHLVYTYLRLARRGSL